LRRASCAGSPPLLLFLALLAACDTTFEPLEDSDYPFSMTGFLDPAADTQWIRVMPLRPTVETNDVPVDAVVTLEEMESGRTIGLNYRLRVIPSPVLQDGEFNAHNFWTDEPIRIGLNYRLRAVRSDGVASFATIPIPGEFTSVHVRDASPGLGFFQRNKVDIFGIAGLAFVFQARTIPPECGYPSPIHLQYQWIAERPDGEGEVYSAGLAWPPLSKPSYVTDPPDCSPYPLGPLRYRVVASASPWPFDASVTDIEFSHPSVAGNVENGVGFVPGLLSKDFPDQSCTRLDPSILTCEITYGPESAAIEGSVLDSCEGSGVDPGVVALAEVAGRWAIGAGVEEDGSYRVEGLDPGREFLMQVSASGSQSYTGETLVLDPLEVRTLPPIVMTASDPEC
jgi:hypothetical protein